MGKSAKSVVKHGRALTDGELCALMAICLWRGTAGGTRDAAIIAVLCVGGLNRSDLVNLELDGLRAGPPLTLYVKTRSGRPDRKAALNGTAADLLMRWVSARGHEPGRLFLPMDNTCRRVSGDRLPPTTVSEMLRRRSTQAGIETVKVADLHATHLRAILSGRRPNTGEAPSPDAIGTDALLTSDPPVLGAAARALAAWRPPDPGGPGPLDTLTTTELERLRLRVSSIIERRAATGGAEPREGEKTDDDLLWKSIYRALADGTPKREVSRLSKVQVGAVASRALVAGGAGPRHVGRGLVTEEAKRFLESDLEERPFATLRERRERLADACGVRVSETSVNYHVKPLGYSRIAGRYMKAAEDRS